MQICIFKSNKPNFRIGINWPKKRIGSRHGLFSYCIYIEIRILHVGIMVAQYWQTSTAAYRKARNTQQTRIA